MIRIAIVPIVAAILKACSTPPLTPTAPPAARWRCRRDVRRARYLAAFVEDMKASGFVAGALARHGVEGAAVAPAAGRT